MTNQPKPAPTAEEQLPPLQDGWTNGDYFEFITRLGYDTPEESPYPESVLEYAARHESIIRQREEQLLAALRSNREKDARLERAEERIRVLAQMFGVCDGGRYLNDWKTKADKLAEKDAKIAELGKESERHLTQAHNAEGHAVYQTRRAEAKLRAVSEAMNDYEGTSPQADYVVARLRAIVEGK